MDGSSRRVVAFVKDLFFGAKIAGAARYLKQQGEAIEVTLAHSSADCIRRVAAEHPSLLVLDLSLHAVDLPAFVRDVRAAAGPTPLTVLAFGPHTDKPGRAAARAAGCDLVVANSRFDRELAPLLQRFSQPGSAGASLTVLDDEEHAEHPH